MEHKLKMNDHKGGWDGKDLDFLIKKLEGEVSELRHALLHEPGINIMLEAADVANYAMMIAWNVMKYQVQEFANGDDGREQGEDEPDTGVVHRPCPHN